MAKHLTPIVGLAVVMALALAAVFGSMSLANPAQAQVTNAPPTLKDDGVGMLTGYDGYEMPALDVTTYFNDGTGTGEISEYVVAIGDTEVVRAAPLTPDITDGKAETVLTGGDADEVPGITFITITATHGYDGPDADTDAEDPIVKRVQFNLMASTAPMAADPDEIPLTLYSGLDEMEFNLFDHFTDGVGVGKIDSFTVAEPTASALVKVDDEADPDPNTNIATVEIGEGDDLGTLTFDEIGMMTGMVTLTVTAVDGFDADGTGDGTDPDDDLTLEIMLKVMKSTPASTKNNIMPKTATIGTVDTFDASDYFNDGAGTGEIVNYSAMSEAPTVVFASADAAGMVTLTPFAVGAAVVNVYAIDEDGDMENNPRQQFVVTVQAKTTVVTPDTPFKISRDLSSLNPGKNASYTFKFNAMKAYSPGFDHIVLKLTDGDFQVPETIPTSTVSIKAGDKIASPADISVDDTEITLVLGDMDGDAVGVQGIGKGENVTVVFRTAAGIKNPEEGGTYDEDLEIDDQTIPAITIKRTISLSEDEGGRGDEIMVTGKGFKNGTSVTFLRMESAGVKAADFDAGTSLCAGQASDGVASCSFTVTSPLFKHGDNFINAVDGRSNRGDASEPFILEPSISVSPNAGSPGESLLVQLYDFGPGATVSAVKIARRTICSPTGSGAVKLMAACGTGYAPWIPNGMSFRVVIPNDAPLGRQDLQVVTSDGSDNTNITISGPLVTSTPSTVLANQRVSLVGNGFTPSSTLAKITFAGTEVPASRINDGQAVRIDGGGNWNASVNLPLGTSTVSAGVHTVQIEDNGGRKGGVKVTVPEREVTITPSSGRVGTIAVVRGVNFPSRNEEGNSFNVQIVYGSGDSSSTTVSTVPDASGRFEAQMRIPTTSSIPSTNDVSVSFGTSQNGGPWTINVSHDVPEGIINLSASSGGPGSSLSISGEGFRSFVPVNSVMIGSIDITPTPRPSSDANGMVSFDVVVPGLDIGIQTIEVQVGKTTASAGFTVTESGIHPGDITLVAEAVEPLGDNLEVVWHFNNDTKAWTFYDGEEGSSLTHMITGETYLIQVRASVEVILNHDTRNLTCAAGNCWNQIVW